MAAIDDILGRSGSPVSTKTLRVAPPPVDVSMEGAPSSVGSRPAGEVSSLAKATEPEIPGIDASTPAGVPGTAPRIQPEKKRMSYVELFKALNPQRPETEEERAMREKREKREAVLAAVGDGISALSNLFFTTRYAPNAYDASKGMTAKTRERWDRLRMEREANRRAYNDGYLRAAAMDEAGDREDRNWRHTLERERIIDGRQEAAEQRAERKAERDEQMFQARLALQAGRLTEQGYRNRIAEIKAGKMEELTDAQINRLNRTGSGKGENGGRPGEYPWYDSEGNLHYVHSYEAARQNALQHGTWNEGTQTSTQTRTQKSGRKTTTTTSTTTKPAKGSSGKPGKWSSTSKIKW